MSALLVPKEHGAYGQLLFPLLTAWLVARPTLTSVLFGLAVTNGFLAHEGLTVRLGHRGPRAKREDGPRAAMSLGVFAAFGLLAGTIAFVLSAPVVRGAAVVPVGLAAAALVVTWRDLERTIGGELLASTALAAWSLPIALAAGAPTATGLGIWIVWSLTFAAATLAVRGVIARTRREPWKPRLIQAGAVLTAGFIGLSAASDPPWAALRLPLLPAGALVLGLGLLPIGARHLHRVGWTIVAVSLVTMALLVWELRA
jgi:hypothetical protein